VRDTSGPRDDETMMSAVETRSSGSGEVNSSTNYPHGYTNNNEQTSSDASTEELRQTVLAQLEYYFSPYEFTTKRRSMMTVYI